MDPDQRETILEGLGELAALSGVLTYAHHADYIRETIGAFAESDDAGWDHLASIQFWGGPGSISDANLGPRHMELLRDLASAVGAHCPVTASRERWIGRAVQLGEILTVWLADPADAKPMML